VQFSPANTSIKLSTYPDDGLYFRTAPPDTFQGAVLGNLVASDGSATAAVLALQDAYGEGLAKTFEGAFTEAGGSVTETVIYDPKAADYSADVAKIAATNPDAIALIGFDESAKIVAELIKQGVGPQTKKLYLVDGNLSNSLFKDLPAGTMNGVKGTTPGAAAPEDFRAALLKVNPALTDFSYSAESYDAVNLIALAAQAAGKDSGQAIAASLVDVSEKGEKCSNFADCKKLLDDGKDIDYDGVSGPCDLADNGDPKKATMGIYQYGPDNKFPSTAIKYESGDVPAAS
jgi:branched-chain amino acid transport system substrate-binding protein